MRIDPQVNRAKFDEEVRRLQDQRETLWQGGCWVYRAEHPNIDVVFVPRAPLTLMFPISASKAGPDGSTLIASGWQAFQRPNYTARAFGARLGLDDFDQRAPSVTFCDPWTWTPLTPPQLVLGHILDEASGTQRRVVIDQHPKFERPFLCVRGTREYHEHPQHDGDPWELLRGDFGAFSLVRTISRACIEGAAPHAFPILGIADVLPTWQPGSPERSQG